MGRATFIFYVVSIVVNALHIDIACIDRLKFRCGLHNFSFRTFTDWRCLRSAEVTQIWLVNFSHELGRTR